MTTRILLTGAGFSKNWGGYLAREIWERLVGHPKVRAHERTREALLNAPEDFEAALAAVRRLGNAEADGLESALLDVFEEQDRAEIGDWFDIDRDKFSAFLDGFRQEDGTARLFTVNQDLFIERTYGGTPGLFAPGIGDVAFRSGMAPFSAEHRREVDMGRVDTLVTGEANYIKLHGSFNWRSSDGHTLVVAGGDKEDQIAARFPLLDSYLQLFRHACSAPDAWLVVAGYSFRDEHINSAILEGSRSGLRLVVLDTQSPKALRASPGLRDGQIWSALVGYSSAPLIDILRGQPMADEMIASWLGR